MPSGERDRFDGPQSGPSKGARVSDPPTPRCRISDRLQGPAPPCHGKRKPRHWSSGRSRRKAGTGRRDTPLEGWIVKGWNWVIYGFNRNENSWDESWCWKVHRIPWIIKMKGSWFMVCSWWKMVMYMTGWWFGTFFLFSYIGNNI